MPTIQEFIDLNPLDYGAGNANLLISSSAVNPPVDQTPVPPYYIQGLTIPIKSKNSKQVKSALLQVETLKFTYEGDIKNAPVIDRQVFPDYVYLEINPLESSTLPTDISTVLAETVTDEEFIFIPFFESNFFNDDYNVLINNNQRGRLNSIRQIVDRKNSQANPSNLELIILQTATKAELQDSNYTQRSRIQGRYLGGKLDSKGVPGQEPAIQLTQFRGSVHPLTSNVTSIKALNPSDRKEEDLFFTSYISGSGGNFEYASFPQSSSFLFREVQESNRFEKITSKFVLSVENNRVFTSNENGGVILEQ